MDSRRTAIVIGVLFLISYAGVFGAEAVFGDLLDPPDYLARISPERVRMVLGVIVSLMNDVAIVAIAAFLFPLLKKEHEAFALAYHWMAIITSGASCPGRRPG